MNNEAKKEILLFAHLNRHTKKWDIINLNNDCADDKRLSTCEIKDFYSTMRDNNFCFIPLACSKKNASIYSYILYDAPKKIIDIMFDIDKTKHIDYKVTPFVSNFVNARIQEKDTAFGLIVSKKVISLSRIKTDIILKIKTINYPSLIFNLTNFTNSLIFNNIDKDMFISKWFKNETLEKRYIKNKIEVEELKKANTRIGAFSLYVKTGGIELYGLVNFDLNVIKVPCSTTDVVFSWIKNINFNDFVCLKNIFINKKVLQNDNIDIYYDKTKNTLVFKNGIHKVSRYLYSPTEPDGLETFYNILSSIKEYIGNERYSKILCETRLS